MAKEGIEDVLSSTSKLASYNVILQEPECKKPKLAQDEATRNRDDSLVRPAPILGDDLLPTENALGIIYGIAAKIKTRKNTQDILKFLTTHLPLPDMAHVKRVRSANNNTKQSEILLLVQHEHFAKYDWIFESMISLTCITPSMENAIPEISKFADHLENLALCKIPSRPPLTRPQFELSQKFWPVAFHENKRASILLSGRMFSQANIASVNHFIATARRIGEDAPEPKMGAVIVDPKNDEIIASACDLRSSKLDFFSTGKPFLHPLQHASMVLIDSVAWKQGGGTFGFDLGLCGDVHTKQKEEDGEICKQNDGSYICSGYDIYLSHEPCVMCSMALLHSRIRRVFYAIQDPKFGGLGGKFKVHAMQQLNHRFEVFHCS